MELSYKPILGYLEDMAAAEPGKECYGADGRWLDVSAVLERVRQIGAALQRLQLKPGDFVALRTERNLESGLMILGLRAAGLVAVLCDPRQDILSLLNGAETPIPAVAMIEQTEKKTVFRVTRLSPGPAETAQIDLTSLPPWEGESVRVDVQAPAFVIFTSGSTGKSKAVVLSEFNLVNNLVESKLHGRFTGRERGMCALPLHHVFGLVFLLCGVIMGFGNYFPERADIPSLLSAVQEHKLNVMSGVPALYMAMAEHSKEYDLSSLSFGNIGGGPITVQQFTWVEQTLHMILLPVYGLSECPGVSYGYIDEPMEIRAAGVGPFYASNTGKILLDNGEEAGPMEVGEICVNGPSRMIGYLGHPMAPEELFHTGDLGYLDHNGVLHLTGRKKDIIIRNGNNLSPLKIEQALLSAPGIRQAVVVGLPDERQGEVPAAMVVADPGVTSVDVPMPKNEIPVLYEFVDAIPTTPVGKPDKQKVREMLLKRMRG